MWVMVWTVSYVWRSAEEVYACMRGALSETYLMHVRTRWQAEQLVADIGFAMAVAIADRLFVFCDFIEHCAIRRTNERQNR